MVIIGLLAGYVGPRYFAQIGKSEAKAALAQIDGFEKAIEHVVSGAINFKEIKFFIGYSGWGAGQLAREVKQNAWYLHPAREDYVFGESNKNLWRTVLYDKGGDFRVLSTYPDDPTLN